MRISSTYVSMPVLDMRLSSDFRAKYFSAISSGIADAKSWLNAHANSSEDEFRSTLVRNVGKPPSREAAQQDFNQSRSVISGRDMVRNKLALSVDTPSSFIGMWHAAANSTLASQQAKEGALLLKRAGEVALKSSRTIKDIYNRKRPFQEFPEQLPLLEGMHPSGGSFPSGHSSYSASQAVTLAALAPSSTDKLFDLAAQVGYSRIYGAAHYTSDVLAGAYVGAASATFAIAHPTSSSRWSIWKSKSASL